MSLATLVRSYVNSCPKCRAHRLCSFSIASRSESHVHDFRSSWHLLDVLNITLHNFIRSDVDTCSECHLHDFVRHRVASCSGSRVHDIIRSYVDSRSDRRNVRLCLFLTSLHSEKCRLRGAFVLAFRHARNDTHVALRLSCVALCFERHLRDLFHSSRLSVLGISLTRFLRRSRIDSWSERKTYTRQKNPD